ncbi:MAG: hypothetical protein AAGA34_14130, partial [Pseudomonadota bacterium]
MDTLRGTFESGDHSDRQDFDDDHDTSVDAEGGEASRDLPPTAIGQDERRMQVRAYNHWAGLLGDRTYPSIEDLDLNSLTDFGPYSVLLDFSVGIEDPVVHFLGSQLAEECSAPIPIERLSDVPPRSLLSRITDHYMQIMANQAPIGFEAEFVNQRGASILYRGILLPFSSDDETIDFIYGVINWKEMADAATADELLLEIDQALDADEEVDDAEPARHHEDTIEDWADSPAHEAGEEDNDALITPPADALSDNIADFETPQDTGYDDEPSDADLELPVPDFGQYTLDDPYADEDEDENEDSSAGYSFASLSDHIDAPARKVIDLDAEKFDPDHYRVDEAPTEPAVPQVYEAELEDAQDAPEPFAAWNEPDAQEPDTQEPGTQEPDVEPVALEWSETDDLHGCLASARELARNASVSEDRSRQALYAAVGR